MTPLPNGDYLAGWGDSDLTRRELYRHSPKDADAIVEFGRLMHHMAMAVRPLLGMIPPDPTSLAPSDLKGMLKLGKHFRSLGAERFHALYKLMTMSSADYLDEWFEFGPLKATKSASGIIGTFLGPRSPGLGVRAAASLHGRDRRRVPRVGIRERRQRLGEPCDRERRDVVRRADPHGSAGQAAARARTGGPPASCSRTATNITRRSSSRASIRAARSSISSRARNCPTISRRRSAASGSAAHRAR